MPSSVSRRIDDLETRLEVRLFDRHHNGMTLTSAGRDLFDRARSMQHHADEIERSLRARDNREEGRVTVTAPDGAGSLWLAPRIADFTSRNPKIQIALDCRPGGADEPATQSDITIALSPQQANVGDDSVELATMHYVLLAAPEYLETYGTPNSAASAAGDHRILRHTGQIAQRETWSERTSALAALASFSFETNSSAAFVHALRAGAGIGFGPTYLLTFAPELRIIDPEQITPIKMWLVVNGRSRHSARVTRVADWIKQIFDPRAHPWFRTEFVHPDDFDVDALELARRQKH